MKKILSFVTTLIFATGITAFAAQFTDGNIVVQRMGDGTATLTNAGTRVFLDEYTPSGTLVQTIPMPTNYFGAYSPLIANGTTFGNGLMTRSVDGRFILLGGFGALLGQSSGSVGTSFATDIPRVTALVDGVGNIDTTTTLTNSAADSQEPRCPVSTDGTNIWVGAGTSGGYIAYTTRGSNDATILSGLNTRQIRIYSNRLYVTSANFGGINTTGSVAILTNAFGTTPPTATNSTGFLSFAPLTTNSASAFGFAFFKLNGADATDPDTLYLTDSTNGKVDKYSLVGGTWVRNGFVSGIQTVIGLTGQRSVISPTQTNVVLYITQGGTTLTGGNNIGRFTDTTGFNAAPDGNDLALIVSASPNKAFRGVVNAPSTNSALALPSGAGRLSVGPVIDVFAKGYFGCVNMTETDVYSLANPGTSSIGWTAAVDSNWVSLSASSGTLTSMGSINVTATLNANMTSLTLATNTAIITFSNVTTGVGTTKRNVTLYLYPQDVDPNSDYTVTGQPGGPFSPLGKSYTIFNGSPGITLRVNTTSTWANVVVGTTTGSSVTVSLGACGKTNVSVVVLTNGVGGANSLAAGNYSDLISFSNTTANTLIDTRAANLTVGGVFFCDDFSTYVQNANLASQQGWVSFGAGPQLQVTNGAVYNPAATAAVEEPYKNIPQTGTGFVYAAMSIMVTSAPPVGTASPSRGPTFFTGQNESGFARDFLSARDTGTNQYVFCIRINAAGNAFVFGTAPLNYNQKYNVIMRAQAAQTNQVLWVNPGSTENTNVAYLVQQNIGAIDFGVGCISLQSQFTASATPSPGYAVFKVCITTNYTEAYNDLNTGGGGDPYSTWVTSYGLSGGNAGGTADPDGDGMSNTNEFLAGFNPNNSSARLRIISIDRTTGTNVTVTYLGASGDSTYAGGPASRTNILESTTGAAGGSFSNNFVSTGQTNILSGGTGLGQTATFIHTNGATGPTRYYRVRVPTP